MVRWGKVVYCKVFILKGEDLPTFNKTKKWSASKQWISIQLDRARKQKNYKLTPHQLRKLSAHRKEVALNWKEPKSHD